MNLSSLSFQPFLCSLIISSSLYLSARSVVVSMETFISHPIFESIFPTSCLLTFVECRCYSICQSGTRSFRDDALRAQRLCCCSITALFKADVISLGHQINKTYSACGNYRFCYIMHIGEDVGYKFADVDNNFANPEICS